jgi:hypothetical protein
MQRNHLPKLIMLTVALLLSSQAAFAQLRIVGAVSGTVQDPGGAAVQGAQVVLKDVKTGITKEATTGGSGTFFFPDLVSGVYEVTITMQGFQKALVQNVNVSTSQTTDVKIGLEVGQPTETVTVVAGASQLLETSGQLVANTIPSQTITQLPVGNRSNVLALARLAPGAMPPTGGSTRYNNLPGGAVNVTVDGINDASNGFKSGGTVFFATVPVRLGAVEEVTVETAGLGADSGAQSGANIKFTTKRGGNEYHGSFFYEPRSERFNANTWSRNAQNLPRAFNRTQEYGGNIGGPLIPFGSFKKKAFFFINYERSYSPQTRAVNVSVLTPAAQQGIFTWLVPATNNTPAHFESRNVLTLVATTPLPGGVVAPTTIDPIVANILAINNQVPQFSTQVTDTDLNRDTFTWLAENNNYAYFPAVRFDFFVTPKQQVTWSWNYRHNWQAGERRLPVPDISRTNPFRLGYFVWAFALQSTFTPNTFNEFRYGVQHSGDSNASADYGPYYTVQDKPLRIGGTLPFGPTVPFIDQQNVTGRHFITTMYDTLTMNRGNHTLTVGLSYRRTDWKDIGQIFQVPTYNLGTPNSNDPVPGTVFTAGNFPGLTNTQLGDPLALYNTLIGRVSAANFTRVVDPDTLKYDGFHNFTWTRSVMGGAYAQDRWRFSPTLTFNYGLRWEAQGPMHDVKKITAVPDLASLFGPSKGLFSPGVLSGNNNPQVTVGAPAYKTDWLTLAPNFGFAWNPNFTKGFLGKLFGGSKTVLRGAYSLNVYDEGTQFYAQNLGTNAGKTIAATALVPGQSGQTNLPRFYTLSNIVANSLTVSNFAFTSSTDYKPVINQADQTFARTISGFDPTLRAPYTINFNLGFQREVWDNGVIEARYVGTRTHLAWRTSNLNEVNIFENGFLQQFKNAQNNLAINVAAGSTGFANQGRPGQVALPIFDAAFGARGALGAIASASGYTNPAFITNLQNGEAGGLANTLATNQNYVCRMFGNSFSPCLRVQPLANAPGVFPINFFLLNPFVAGRMNFVDDTGWHSYDGLQIQFRQRLTHGINWNANYTWSHSLTNLPADNANQGIDFLTLRNTDLDKRPSQFDIRHVVQTYGTYDLPIGRGRMFNIDNKILNGVIGGWTVGSIFVFATGQPIQLTGGFATVNTSNSTGASGVVLAPGVTLAQIQQLFDAPLTRLTGRPAGTTTDLQRLAVDPSLIGPDFRANPAFLLPNRTPGSFGQQLFIRDKNTFQWDMSITKAFHIVESTRLELFASLNNVLNHPRWAFSPDTTGNPPAALNVFSTSFGVINGPIIANGNRTINLRATLSF